MFSSDITHDMNALNGEEDDEDDSMEQLETEIDFLG